MRAVMNIKCKYNDGEKESSRNQNQTGLGCNLFCMHQRTNYYKVYTSYALLGVVAFNGFLHSTVKKCR